MSGPGAILVTGGAGYVGSHVTLGLLRAGRRVVVLDDLSAGRREAVGAAPLVVGAAEDEALVREVVRAHGVEAAVHCAGRIRVEESVADPAGYHHANVEVTRRLAQALLEGGVRALVFSSSAAVYGTPIEVPIPETHPFAPTSPYGATKVAAEAVLASSGLAVASLRYFNAAGAAWREGLGERHEPETHLIPLAIEAALHGRPFVVHGGDWPTRDGSCERDYVHVEDLASAHVAALDLLRREGARAGARAWNLGTGRGFTVHEVLAEVARAVGRPVDARTGPRRAGDPAVLVADAGRARRDLAFRPTRSDLPRLVEDAVAFRVRVLGAAAVPPSAPPSLARGAP